MGELLELDSPADSDAVPLPDPKDSPHFETGRYATAGDLGIGVSILGGLPLGMNDNDQWTEESWRRYWANNPLLKNQAKPLRRDVKQAILLKIEQLFDRNTDNWQLLEDTSESMLSPYRIGLGV